MAISGRDVKDWLQPLIDAGIVPHETRRIIIDVPCENVVKVFYECYGDHKIFTIDLADMVTGAEAIGVADVPEKT